MNEKKKTILKTIDYIETHLNQNLSLDEISSFIGYSKFHLNRLFSQTVGCTIHKYIQKRRLTVAAEKLVTTNDKITDIAYEAKYESQQAFNLAFRQLYLYPPTVYRRNGIFVTRQTKLTMFSKAKTKYKVSTFYNKNSIIREVHVA